MRLAIGVLALACLAATASGQEETDELVIIPRSEVRNIIAELNRLRAEVKRLENRLIGCKA